MKVLVVGSGAREHALCLSLARDSAITELWCAPGNAGIADVARLRDVDPEDRVGVADLAEDLAADLVVIGPERPLVAGVADECRRRGFAVFGPNAAAAALEGSKSFAKEIMRAAGVPTAASGTYVTAAGALAALDERRPPYVVKFDGLAAGKGVTVTESLPDARAAVTAAFAGAFGTQDVTVVLEDYLDGPEVSLFAVTDGVTVVPLVPAQDAKRLRDGDEGPNTGGMGAYSPLPWAPDTLVDDVVATVMQPTVDELARRGTPFVGLLYAGLAVTADGIRVVEFNARFGDPETQVVLARLRSPLAGLLHAAATGALTDRPPLQWSTDAAVTVVIASDGYPEHPRVGDVIGGLAEAAAVDGVRVLHAGTRRAGDDIVSAGGRVLSITATGATLDQARERAYAAVDCVALDGAQHRSDIAAGAVRTAAVSG